MGYARIFWLREEPIRHYIAVNGRDDAIIAEVGRRVLSLAAKDSFRGKSEDGGALPVFDTPSVFFPFRSFHATDFCILLWTGNRLCALPAAGSPMLDALCEMTRIVGTAHVLLPISKAEYHRAIGGGKWQNTLEQDVYASLYYIYEDFTREFERQPEADWPCKEVGAATLNLMLSNWSRSKDIRNHGSALSRVCSFNQPECAVLVWSRNCLRLISEIEPDEIQKMHEHLGRE